MPNRIKYERKRTVFYHGEMVVFTGDEYYEKQLQMFARIWRERAHRCFVTKDRLGIEPLTFYFHHILEKRAYEKYALCKWNIILLSKDVHNAYETKSDTQPFLVELREHYLQCLDQGCEFDNDVIYDRPPVADHLFAIVNRPFINVA
jgi:hypothetical protein